MKENKPCYCPHPEPIGNEHNIKCTKCGGDNPKIEKKEKKKNDNKSSNNL